MEENLKRSVFDEERDIISKRFNGSTGDETEEIGSCSEFDLPEILELYIQELLDGLHDKVKYFVPVHLYKLLTNFLHWTL